MIDHDLMESLEYTGEYGARYRCFQCSNFKDGDCNKLNNENIKVSGDNNICRLFEARIRNPSSPLFDFDDYLEFLMSDYYRPFGIDSSIVAWYIDRPSFYTHDKRHKIPVYKTYDKPYCRIVKPLTVVSLGKYNFELDYRLYRENKWISEGKIQYRKCYWKDKETARKYQVLYDGEFDLYVVGNE